MFIFSLLCWISNVLTADCVDPNKLEQGVFRITKGFKLVCDQEGISQIVNSERACTLLCISQSAACLGANYHINNGVCEVLTCSTMTRLPDDSYHYLVKDGLFADATTSSSTAAMTTTATTVTQDNSPKPVCSGPCQENLACKAVGMESGDISDDQISASSDYGRFTDGDFSYDGRPRVARLNRFDLEVRYREVAWFRDPDVDPHPTGWIRVNLTTPLHICSIAIQGPQLDANRYDQYYVEAYKLQIDDTLIGQSFTGVTGTGMTSQQCVAPSMSGSVVTILPTAFRQTDYGMRLEIYACL